MNVRWLLGNFADPQYDLGPEEQRELNRLAHEKYMPGRTFFWWTFGVLIIPVLAIFRYVLPLFLGWLGLAGRTMPFVAGAVIILFLFWLWSSWVYGCIYTRPMRNAMREKGYDVCVSCGYLLTGLKDTVRQCPECGRERERLAPGE